MYKSKASLIFSILIISFLFSACSKLKQDTVFNREKSNVSEIIADEIPKKSLDEFEDKGSLIAEPGLEINGVIKSISDNLITIVSLTDYTINRKRDYDNKENTDEYIDRELCFSPNTLYYKETNGLIKSITREELTKDDTVRYSFTIAATGEPMLYSITVLE